LPEHNLDRGEFFPLLVFSTVGAMALAAAGDFPELLRGPETMSLGVYWHDWTAPRQPARERGVAQILSAWQLRGGRSPCSAARFCTARPVTRIFQGIGEGIATIGKASAP